jgi:hypothetical protein
MRLSEIHTAIEAGRGPKLPEDQAFATLVAIEHLARVEGLPVSGLDFVAPQFGKKYILRFTDLRGSWSGRTQYLAWRNLILNAQMRFAPGDVESDPWASLNRAQRLWKPNRQATLYSLYTLLPPATHPRDVSDALLDKVYPELEPKVLGQLRAGMRAFRELFQNDLALRTGLLPSAFPSLTPSAREILRPTTMSEDIKGFAAGLSARNAVIALNYVNRLAIAGGQLNGKTDTLDDLRFALCKLRPPEEVGVPPIKTVTLHKYINEVRHVLGGPDPRKTPAEQAWADLRTAARAAGCETSFFWALAKPAAVRNLLPGEISENVALELMRSYDQPTMRSLFRRGCEQFDALRGKVPPELLPLGPLGIKRSPPRAPKPVLPPNPVKTAWADLYRRLHDLGWTHHQIGVLSYLRVRATTAGVAPDALNHDFFDQLRRGAKNVSDRARLQAATLTIAKLSKTSYFNDLPDLAIPDDRRFSHGGLGEQARGELEELMEFMNAAASTRRSFRVTVGVITDAMGRRDIALKGLLQTDISAYDIGHHEPRRKTHTNNIRNLREFMELPWTPAWRELQRLVTGAGMTALKNPVPKVLSWKPGTDPDGLTLEWAQQLDRHFRSTITSPPHGRADLAKTLARHLAAFDALHDIPAVAGSGLLPPRIGPIR